MPYLSGTDQYYWDPYRQKTEAANPGHGKTFSMDGSDYDPTIPKPKLSDAYRFLSRHFRPSTRLLVTIVGKLYKGRSTIDGLTFPTDMNSLEYASVQGGHGGGGTATLESKMEELSGYTDFERITGIYIRALD